MGMLNAIETGKVKESTITAAVGRILVQMDRFGYLDKGTKHDVTPEDRAFNTPILQKTAEDAAVLLKNENFALPISTAELASVALIGPGAAQTIAIGLPGGKGPGIPSSQVGTVAAIEKVTGKKVVFAVANDMTGVPVPAAALSHGGTPGLLRGTQADAQLDFTLSNGRALPPGSQATWSGALTIPSDGSYMLALQVLGAAGIAHAGWTDCGAYRESGPPRLDPASNQDNVLPTTDGLDNARNLLSLKAGPHEISVAATGEQAGQPVQIRLAWVTPQATAS